MTVHYMASMARCGETLLLRCLDAHSRVTAVGHGFVEFDRARLPEWEADDRVYVVKQGTWEERGPFRGFVLVRNPLAVYRSLRDFESRGGGGGVQARLQRWMAAVDHSIELAGDDVDQFCTFYNRRFGALTSVMPISRRLRYEDVVATPALALGRACALVGVDFEPAVVESHVCYATGHVLHEGTRGDVPIHRGSLDRWRELPGHDITRIIHATRETCAAYGYNLEEES